MRILVDSPAILRVLRVLRGELFRFKMENDIGSTPAHPAWLSVPAGEVRRQVFHFYLSPGRLDTPSPLRYRSGRGRGLFWKRGVGEGYFRRSF